MNGRSVNQAGKWQAGPNTTQPIVVRPAHQARMPSNSGVRPPQVPHFVPQPRHPQTVVVSASRPSAPAVYRPQATAQRAIASVAGPALQQKRAVSASALRPPAPPVYRPQAAVQRAVPLHQRPHPATPFAPQTQRPSTFAQPAATPPRSGPGAPYQPQFTIQPFAPHLLRPPSVSSLPGNSALLTGGVVQRHDQVIQPWKYMGYVTDAISSVAIVGEIIAAIVAAGGATGWGWLVPLLLPALGVLVNGFISYRAESTGQQGFLGEKDTPGTRLMYKVMTFIQLATAATFGVALALHDKNTTLKALAALTTSVVYIVAEILRVNVGLSRKSLYREVWQMIQKCCPWCPSLTCGQPEYDNLV